MPSSVIRSFDYHAEERQLEVRFVSGRRYLYCEVPADEVDQLSSAESRGRYFNRNIRDHYPYREIKRSARG